MVDGGVSEEFVNGRNRQSHSARETSNLAAPTSTSPHVPDNDQPFVSSNSATSGNLF